MSGSTINTVCTRPSSTSYSFGFLAEDKPKWGKQRQRQKAKAKGKQESKSHGKCRVENTGSYSTPPPNLNQEKWNGKHPRRAVATVTTSLHAITSRPPSVL
jgi:hypothetical protein